MLLNELGGSFGNAVIAIVATSAGVPNFRLTERTGKETALPPQQSVDSPRDGSLVGCSTHAPAAV
jgi:hypothetical protein